MKNILNKIGAVSKPVLFGAALGVATVAVGIGVATNYMGDGPKGSAGRVLGHYSADTAEVEYGSDDAYYNDNLSKEAIERQMALNQVAASNGNSLDYLGSAGKGRFAYGQKGNAYQNGVIDPMAMNNAAYEGENNGQAGMSEDVAGAMNDFNNTAAAVRAGGAGSAKGNSKAKAVANGVLETSDTSFGTKVNKLNSSGKTGGSVSGSKGGGVRNMGQIQGYAGGNDRAQTPIKTPNVGNMPQSNISGIDSAKHGRVGQMGGNGSRGAGGKGGGSGQSFGFDGATVALVHAQKYSDLANKTSYSEEAKQLVEEAFDGSVAPDEGVQIDGSTPLVERAAKMERMGNTINKNSKNLHSLDVIGQEATTFKNAKKQLMLATLAMIGATALVAIVLAAMANSWPIILAKIAVLLAGIVGIWVIYGSWMLKHINALKGLNYIKDAAGAWPWLAPTLGGVCTAALGVAFFSKTIGEKFTSWSEKLAANGTKGFNGWLSKILGKGGTFLSEGGKGVAKGIAKGATDVAKDVAVSETSNMLSQ